MCNTITVSHCFCRVIVVEVQRCHRIVIITILILIVILIIIIVVVVVVMLPIPFLNVGFVIEVTE